MGAAKRGTISWTATTSRETAYPRSGNRSFESGFVPQKGIRVERERDERCAGKMPSYSWDAPGEARDKGREDVPEVAVLGENWEKNSF